MGNATYTAEAVSTGDGRRGRAILTGSKLELDLTVPEQLGGSGTGTNPEELFAAGFAACFHSALRHVAQTEKVRAARSTVRGRVGLHQGDDGYFLSVALEVRLPGVPADAAERLVRAAEKACPYAKATRGNIDVSVTLLPEQA